MAISRRVIAILLILAALVAGHLEATGDRLAGPLAPGAPEAQER